MFDIIVELKVGWMVILVDEEDCENEGDFVIVVEFVILEVINFMVKYGCGLVCLMLMQECCKQFYLLLMIYCNGMQYGIVFMVSIEVVEGVMIGILVVDWVYMIVMVVVYDVCFEYIVQLGYVFLILVQLGGVFVCVGYIEVGCDFIVFVGFMLVVVICEIIKDDGMMVCLLDLIEFVKEYNLKIGMIVDLIQYCSCIELIIEWIVECMMQIVYGMFCVVLYCDQLSGLLYIVLVCGVLLFDVDMLVCVYELLLVFDLFEMGVLIYLWMFDVVMCDIVECDFGVIVLFNCGDMKEYLIDVFKVFDEEEKVVVFKCWLVDFKMFGIGVQILCDVGVGKMQVLLNLCKLGSMFGYGFEVMGFILMFGGEVKFCLVFYV